jgi:hypothetical protein
MGIFTATPLGGGGAGSGYEAVPPTFAPDETLLVGNPAEPPVDSPVVATSQRVPQDKVWARTLAFNFLAVVVAGAVAASKGNPAIDNLQVRIA